MKLFLEWRAGAGEAHAVTSGSAKSRRRAGRRPNLDIVLTHVDDRFDTRHARPRRRRRRGVSCRCSDSYDFQFLIEDPATVWHLGPERYAEIARRYAQLTPKRDKLAIDINIVERYQDVYPTKQQTGVELLQLVQIASRAFDRVALYFENSIAKADWSLLPSAGAVAKRFERSGEKVIVESDARRWSRLAGRRKGEWSSVALDGRQDRLAPGGLIRDRTCNVVRIPSTRLQWRPAYSRGHVTRRRTVLSKRQPRDRSTQRQSEAARDRRPGRSPVLLADQVLALPRGQHLVSIEME